MLYRHFPYVVATASAFAMLATGAIQARAEDMASKGNRLVFSVTGGGTVAPVREGSSRYGASPVFLPSFESLTLQNGFSLGESRSDWFVSPSLRYLAERDAELDPSLTGMEVDDAALELGLKAGVTTGSITSFVALRHGVMGHDGLVGELGADYAVDVTRDLTLRGGPRASFASAEFMDYAFGVNAVEAGRTGKSAFDPSGGFKSVGVEIGADYRFNEQWSASGSAGWNRLVGEAASSPLTDSKDQFTVSIGLTRRFTVDF